MVEFSAKKALKQAIRLSTEFKIMRLDHKALSQ